MLKRKQEDGGRFDGGGPTRVDLPERRLETTRLEVSEAANAGDLEHARMMARRRRRQRRQAALAYRPRGGWSLGLW
jgi:hypothetical protein